MRRLLATARAVPRVVTPTGRALVAFGLACLAAAAWGGLAELRVLGAMSLLLVLVAVPWLAVPSRVRASLTLQPPRAVVGDTVAASLRGTNGGALPLWQPLVHVPAGTTEAWVRMPTLRRGGSGAAAFEIETVRRSVVTVGPATHLRGDPLGLVRRRVAWCPPVDLYVRPAMVAVATLGSGQLRDLEGVPSDRMSMSDLAFHALREYVPGDDLRHVHWRSSARAGELLVRQYHETRRSHATVVVDSASTSYGDGAFELGASVAASLVACAAREEYLVSLVCGRERVTGLPPGEVLDALCRIEPGRIEPGVGGLADDVHTALLLAPETSVLLVVTGDADAHALAAALWPVPPEVRVLVLRAVPGAAPGLSALAGRQVATVGALPDLPGVMAVAG